MKNENSKNKRTASELEQFSYKGDFEYTYVDQNEGKEPIEPQEALPQIDIEAVKEKRKKKQTKTFVVMLCLLALFLIGLIVIYQTLFRLQNVYIEGVEEQYVVEVVNRSGLIRGQHISQISEDEVRKNLESSNQIVFRDIQIVYPNTVLIRVEPRQRVAVLQWAGELFELDATGRVLSRQTTSILPDDVPLVMGLDVKNLQVGQQVGVSSSKRLNYYRELMYELDVQNFRSHVKLISLSSPDNVYLEIDNGMSVRMGNNEYIRAKVGSIRGNIDMTAQMDGDLTLIVTIPEAPTLSVGIYHPTSIE